LFYYAIAYKRVNHIAEPAPLLDRERTLSRGVWCE
jgi:hypothetical protein